jgi:hypothetical protein
MRRRRRAGTRAGRIDSPRSPWRPTPPPPDHPAPRRFSAPNIRPPTASPRRSGPPSPRATGRRRPPTAPRSPASPRAWRRCSPGSSGSSPPRRRGPSTAPPGRCRGSPSCPARRYGRRPERRLRGFGGMVRQVSGIRIAGRAGQRYTDFGYGRSYPRGRLRDEMACITAARDSAAASAAGGRRAAETEGQGRAGVLPVQRVELIAAASAGTARQRRARRLATGMDRDQEAEVSDGEDEPIPVGGGECLPDRR